MPPIPPATTLSEFRADCAGQPFRALVELYAVRHGARELASQIEALLNGFSGSARGRAERLYNTWNLRGQLGDTPETDCARMVDRVTEEARRVLPAGADEQDLLRSFRLVTLGLALTATLFPAARRRMGIQTAGELAPGSSPGEDD